MRSSCFNLFIVALGVCLHCIVEIPVLLQASFLWSQKQYSCVSAALNKTHYHVLIYLCGHALRCTAPLPFQANGINLRAIVSCGAQSFAVLMHS